MVKQKNGNGKKSLKGQEPLPGLEDRAIPDLVEEARSYAGVRDERIRLNVEEKQSKDRLLGLLKKHKKETYKRDGIEIRLVHEVETVKVRINKNEED